MRKELNKKLRLNNHLYKILTKLVFISANEGPKWNDSAVEGLNTLVFNNLLDELMQSIPNNTNTLVLTKITFI